MPDQLIFTVVPEKIPAIVTNQLNPRIFSNVSTFGAATRLTSDGVLNQTRIVNLSSFGANQLLSGTPQVNLTQTQVVNTSTFGAAPAVSVAPADGFLRPSPGPVNTSTFGANSVAVAPADGFLRPSPGPVNSSTFGSPTVQAQVVGVGFDEGFDDNFDGG